MRYLTVVLRYDDEFKGPLPVPEMDDVILKGEVTSFVEYDAVNVANVAVNALDDDQETIEQITNIIAKGT